ncbi:hypothetical protein [Rhizobium sp. MHM7A]|uniref:hypothetical protein n=1 Tax=Rhizobium sp. MHM7A TaxID=2583233 RepID=UPI0011070950|nr:hypothetical protein [Rhizobium sp. MHM7A]TLX15969.1 hypothetical protein FFR93_01240 [Rhizobium sp. MHM7A]
MTFIDSFSSGLDDLPLRKQRSTRHVLQHLERHGRFSVFEATDNDTIAATVDRVIRRGYIETDISCGYPWTKTQLTEAGKAYLAKLTPA